MGHNKTRVNPSASAQGIIENAKPTTMPQWHAPREEQTIEQQCHTDRCPLDLFFNLLLNAGNGK
jgi:hypothetical protein